jgi:hypothetical protein
MSPFSEQLSDKPPLAFSVYMDVRDIKHNRDREIKHQAPDAPGDRQPQLGVKRTFQPGGEYLVRFRRGASLIAPRANPSVSRSAHGVDPGHRIQANRRHNEPRWQLCRGGGLIQRRQGRSRRKR